MERLGLYLHIPFCRSKCLYCDFCSFPRPQEKTVSAYVAALCRDLERRAADCRDRTVDTVYFGGGTPTVLPDGDVETILDTVCKHYKISPDAEITAECNPATGGYSYFSAMRRAGFNRLSIGLQSANREELRALGRIHDREAFERTWNDARHAGFDNLSVDVMFGIPYQTPESFTETLRFVCSLEPEHLSAYALTLEEGTPLFRQAPRLPMPEEDAVREMYLAMIPLLEANGLCQYEISNFARVGYESRHNRKYWEMEEYLGFGPGAYSDFGGVRSGNSRDLESYLRGEEIVAEREMPSVRIRENEFVMLRMRLREGLRIRAFTERFGHPPTAFLEAFSAYRAGGFLRETGDGIAFTPEGFLVSNTILSEVLDFSPENDAENQKKTGKKP